MSAVVEFIGDAVESVVDAVGDVVEAVGDVVEDAVEFVGDVVEAVVENPLPTLLSIAGAAIGIPPMITSAVVTAAQGGDLKDIVLSAGVGYIAPMATNAVSSTLSSVVGDSIINQAVSDTVVNGVSRGLVNGVVSEVRGGDFDDGFAGAFTGTLVSGGVTELTNFVRADVVDTMTDLGLSASTANDILNVGAKAIGAGAGAAATGRDFETAFTNSVINSTANATANFVTNSITDQFNQVVSTNNEIVGAEDGNVRDEETLKVDLADAWANRDISTVNSLLASNNLSSADTQTMFDLTDDDMTNLRNSGLVFFDQGTGGGATVTSTTDTSGGTSTVLGDDSFDLDDYDFTGGDTSTTTTLTDTSTGNVLATGAGIPDTIVDEVETTGLGTNTGNASDVVSQVDTTYTSNDIAGTDSVATISGSDTQSTGGNTQDTVSTGGNSWLNLSTSGYQDVSDIAATVADTSTGGQDLSEDDIREIFGDEYVDELADEYLTDEEIVDIAAGDSTLPVTGGLGAVQTIDAAEDAAEDVADTTSVAPTGGLSARVASDLPTENAQVDLLEAAQSPGVTAVGESGDAATDVAGGLNKVAGTLVDNTKGAVASIPAAIGAGLTTALKQGVTKAVRGALTRPAVRTTARPTKKTGVPTKLTGAQIAALKGVQPKVKAPAKIDISKLKAPTKVATPPKKVDVKTLSPVTNIAGLSSLVGGPGKG